MRGVESTPSVDFQFEDGGASHPTTRPAFEETDVKYEFSCTNDKKNSHFSHQEVPAYLDINREYQVPKPSELESVDTEDFFQDFESRFVVTFDDASRQISSAASKSSESPIENQENSSLLQNRDAGAFQSIRLSIPADISKQYLDRSLCRVNEFKSDIIAVNHKSNCHPMFAIKKRKNMNKNVGEGGEVQSDRITKKRGKTGEVVKLNFPQTCRHFDEQLWASNSGLNRSELFKKISIKTKKRISPFRVKETSVLDKSLQSTNQDLSVKGKNKPLSKYKMKKLEKSNIFLKFPNIR